MLSKLLSLFLIALLLSAFSVTHAQTPVRANSQIPNAQTGTTYTILNSHGGQQLTFSNASPVAVSIAQAGVSSLFKSGWIVEVKNLGVGTVTITPTISTIGGSATLVLATGESAKILSNGTNYLVTRKDISDAQRTVLSNTSGTNTGDQNIFGSVVVSGQTTVTANANPTALTMVAGPNVTLTTNNTSKTVTIAAGTGSGDALTANPLSQFASTTSAQLASVLSDDTGGAGGGLAVFSKSPVIETPTIASFANATHAHQTAAGGGSLDGAAIGSGTIALARNAPQILDDSVGYCADAGSNDTYACSLSPTPASYVVGGRYRFKANTANTGAATINLSSLGAKTIKKVAGGVTTDLADNDIRVNQMVDVTYDGTNMQIQSTLGNAPGDMLLGTAQSVTAAKTYDDTKLKINGGPYGASDESLPAVVAKSWLLNTDSNHLFFGRANGAAWDQQFLAGSSGVISGAYGGTNNGFMDFTGPTSSLKTFTLPNASATILTSNAAVTIAQGGTGNTSISFVTLTDGATVTWTVAGLVNNATVTLAGNRTLAFSGIAAGMSGTLKVVQDGTGSRTLTLPAGSKVINGGSGAITLSTAAASIDILTFIYDGTNYFWTYGKNYN